MMPTGVVAGQAKPLLRPSPLTCPEIHGESGLDGPAGGPLLPHCGASPLPGKAVLVMAERIRAWHTQTGESVRCVTADGCSSDQQTSQLWLS